MFLFNDGPAATTIPVVSNGIVLYNCIVLYAVHKYLAFFITFIESIFENKTAVL